MSTEPTHLPWSYWDGVVEIELRVDEYPYGGGLAGSGVQITLGRRGDGKILAVRLPHESAQRLARAILSGPEPDDLAMWALANPSLGFPLAAGHDARRAAGTEEG